MSKTIRVTFVIFCLLLLSIPALAGQVETLLSAATATGAGSVHAPKQKSATFFAHGLTVAGTGLAIVAVEGSNLNSTTATNWVELCRISLILSTVSASDGCAIDAPWKFVRGKVLTIAGTAGSVGQASVSLLEMEQ